MSDPTPPASSPIPGLLPALPFQLPAHETVSIAGISMNRVVYEILTHLVAGAVTVLCAVALLRLVPVLERVVLRRAKTARGKHPDEDADLGQRVETLTRVTGSVARALIWSVMIIVILGIIGLPIAPLVTSAGIPLVAIGFGAQSIVKDFFSGFFILLEDQFGVGDTITVAGVTGTVEQMTLRITVLRDTSGTAHYIPNSNIAIVSNRTAGWVRVMVDAAFSAELPEETVRAALDAAAAKVSKAEGHEERLLEPVAVEGPIDFKGGAVTYRLAAKAHAAQAQVVRRHLISALQEELGARGLGYEADQIVQRKK